ncbi:DesA family fatty acid desaturase [Methylovorus glucosotrophus]|jgi:stearoyl-CoA desaturase (Delta-9 desaturase)|uniref:Fatty acid desaturase n=1 Tax=Methylovorus glucosotrophus (strain SIP3-4) TaxID=582744 RepID=C6X8W2_METGS|nr:fatty acid desaturase [Methylovorus glucosotrophus]ACT49582.1 fatty acid desaturase [Methylovorus glucosotrophus SIP3-4]
MTFWMFDLPWWGYILVALGLTHITIAAVTIYLHRCQAHRALDLHPIVSHFFRFWLWMTTGMVTKEWAAIHRKHHAHCETVNDPHSPQILGIKKVLREGAELYRKEAANEETLQKYGSGTPDDWMERHVYSRHSGLGIRLMLIIDVLLFGPLGLTIWAVQMAWIPLTAAGIINGLGHYWGYRNFAAADASTNLVPWGIIIGGEELHNNHHAYASSARLSSKWYEFDIGWMYIRLMQMSRLAKVKKIAPKVKFDWAKTRCDLDTLQAVITHRFDVMGKYGVMLKQAYKEEISKIRLAYQQHGHETTVLERLRHWLHLDAKDLEVQDKQALEQALTHSARLQTIYQLKQELAQVWARSTASQEQLLKGLEDWCQRAEKSGIAALEEFSRRLRCYRMA